MKIQVLLVCVILSVEANIDVGVTAAKDKKRSAVHASGQSIESLSAVERESFDLTDQRLKSLIEKYFGAYPQNVYLNEDDSEEAKQIYKRFGWTPVTRTLYPAESKIVRISTEPSIVAEQKFINNFKKSGIFNAAISKEVKNEFTTSWSSSKEITIGQQIYYGVNVGVFSLGGSTHYSFTGSWGQEDTKKETVVIGTTSAVAVSLGPGDFVIASLSSTKGSVEVLVEYEAYLHGQIIFTYPKRFKGSREHRVDVDDLLYYNGLPEEIRRNETLKIDFYADAIVEIKDEEDQEIAEGTCFMLDKEGGGPYGEQYLSTTFRTPRRNKFNKGNYI